MNIRNFRIIAHIDHGKSTLIGRLLYDTNSLPDDKMKEIKKVCEELGRTIEFAYIIDNLQEEREQQLTLDTAQTFFKTKKITILSQKQIDKKEVNFTGEVNSNLGPMKVFVKFKDKKKISDSDFITAHNESGRMPLYFISSGDLTKKAEDYIKNNFLIYEKLK